MLLSLQINLWLIIFIDVGEMWGNDVERNREQLASLKIQSEKQIYVHNIIYGMITQKSSKGCDVLRNS